MKEVLQDYSVFMEHEIFKLKKIILVQFRLFINSFFTQHK